MSSLPKARDQTLPDIPGATGNEDIAHADEYSRGRLASLRTDGKLQRHNDGT